MLPLVTICIPIFNGEKYLNDALLSANAQSYQNIEILISDDSSVDKSLQICDDFKKISRFSVRILSHEQLGLVQNWNFCVRNARGKYIKFLFQDDLLEPDCVEKMVNIAEIDPQIGIVFSKRYVVLGNHAPDADWIRRNWYFFDLYKHWTSLKETQSGNSLLSDSKLLQEPLNKIGEPTTVLLLKSSITALGFFDETLRQAVDSEMWFRILTKYKCGFVDQYLSTYRVHDKQASQENVNSGIIQDDYCALLGKIATHPAFAILPETQRCIAWVKAWQMNPRNSGISLLTLAMLVNSEILSKSIYFRLLIWKCCVVIFWPFRRTISDFKWWQTNWRQRVKWASPNQK